MEHSFSLRPLEQAADQEPGLLKYSLVHLECDSPKAVYTVTSRLLQPITPYFLVHSTMLQTAANSEELIQQLINTLWGKQLLYWRSQPDVRLTVDKPDLEKSEFDSEEDGEILWLRDEGAVETARALAKAALKNG